MYKVVLHNDDYTPMEFVVEILEQVFRKPRPVAVEIMLSVHCGGRGICGVYPREVAAEKASRVHRLARENEYPLRCSVETD
jgi:ATP-dependent Clp protease adaptor protein ClpS